MGFIKQHSNHWGGTILYGYDISPQKPHLSADQLTNLNHDAWNAPETRLPREIEIESSYWVPSPFYVSLASSPLGAPVLGIAGRCWAGLALLGEVDGVKSWSFL